MKCTFKKSKENEIRIKFEEGEAAEVTLHYKDKKSLEAGIKELQKRGLYDNPRMAEK